MIEFSGMYHYAQLPEIGLFTQGAFPFSKYADLSQTAAVIDDKASGAELTTLFNAIGRIGAATGTAPVHLTIASPDETAPMQNKDLLVVGKLPATVLDISQDSADALAQTLEKWFEKPAAKANDKAEAKADAKAQGQNNAKNEVKSEETKDAAPEFLTTGFAVISSIKSPLAGNRTLVALLSEGARGAHVLNSRLARPGDLAEAAGGTVFVGEDTLTGFAPESTYTVGDMPWLRRVWLSLADRPFILVFCALAAALVAGAGIFLYMRRWIRRRA